MNRYTHPSERGFDFPQPGESHLASSRLIEASTRCHFLGIGESSSSSSTTDSRSVADGGAELTNITGASKSNVAASGGTLVQGSNVAGLFTGSSVGAGAKVAGGDILTTTLDFAGARIGDENNTDFSGAKLGSSEIGSITITDTGGEILTQALDRVTEFAAASEASRAASQAGLLQLAQLGQATAAATATESTSKLATLLDALADAKTETDPQARKDNTLLYVLLAILAYFFLKK